ncbi:MAG TPA: transporter [Casimicrobiaceae bacterium]|nr:transporter [Casimicrobiaceae bacterium]
MRSISTTTVLAFAAAVLTFAAPAQAQQSSDADLANKLNNPVASLISLPIQYNWDHEFGPDRDGHKTTLNVQPVIPSKLNGDWNLISRVIVPIVDQHVPFLGDGSQSGIGDITGEFFFSPSKPTANGAIWGVGPAIIVPTDVDFISGGKWALGPTAVVLKQESGLTYGALLNHVWSVGGSGAQSISSTFIQPFLAYTTEDAWTYSLNTESTYDWTHRQWTVPINALVSKLTRIGKRPISFGLGARYYADSPDSGPHGWGVRAVVTLLFPE